MGIYFLKLAKMGWIASQTEKQILYFDFVWESFSSFLVSIFWLLSYNLDKYHVVEEKESAENKNENY